MHNRHKWDESESMWNGQPVHRCRWCGTERTRDTSTATLYLYRRGRAPLRDEWVGFKFGVRPKCLGREEPTT